jgi:hypothetical protein
MEPTIFEVLGTILVVILSVVGAITIIAFAIKGISS